VTFGIKCVVFLLVTAVAAYVFHGMASGTWGKQSDYHVVRRGTGRVAGDQKATIYVTPRDTKDDRVEFELSEQSFSQILAGDELHLQRLKLPVGGERIDYTVLRSGVMVYEWKEGEPFYYSTLVVLSVAAGAVLLFLLAMLMNMFKVGKGARD
jgi:hypothetical protein